MEISNFLIAQSLDQIEKAHGPNNSIHKPVPLAELVSIGGLNAERPRDVNAEPEGMDLPKQTRRTEKIDN